MSSIIGHSTRDHSGENLSGSGSGIFMASAACQLSDRLAAICDLEKKRFSVKNSGSFGNGS
jgi:hypothetical protein